MYKEYKKLEAEDAEEAEFYASQPRKCFYCDKFADEDQRCWECEELVCLEHLSKVYDPDNDVGAVYCYKCATELNLYMHDSTRNE